MKILGFWGEPLNRNYHWFRKGRLGQGLVWPDSSLPHFQQNFSFLIFISLFSHSFIQQGLISCAVGVRYCDWGHEQNKLILVGKEFIRVRPVWNSILNMGMCRLFHKIKMRTISCLALFLSAPALSLLGESLPAPQAMHVRLWNGYQRTLCKCWEGLLKITEFSTPEKAIIYFIMYKYTDTYV